MKTRKNQIIRLLREGLLAAGCALGVAAINAAEPACKVPDQGTLALHSRADTRFQFEGVLGQRLEANREQWLMCAPQANPGLLEMFRVRDRQPAPDIMPWAGEFVGKYLISAVQDLRLSDRPALWQQVSNVVAGLIATQAEDGYLGPFPKATRLKGNWDLWGQIGRASCRERV